MQNSKNKKDLVFLLNGMNRCYIEQIYRKYLNNPKSVSSDWEKTFREFFLKKVDQKSVKKNLSETSDIEYNNVQNDITTNIQVLNFINAFRKYGHIIADIDPLNLKKTEEVEELSLKFYGFSDNIYDQKFNSEIFGIKKNNISFKEILSFLRSIYCGPIGFEYMHLDNIKEKIWIQKYIERNFQKNFLEKKEKKSLLKNIIEAEEIEHFLGRKFPGAKRFSLEGGESLIPMLKEVVIRSSQKYNTKNIIFGMSHRGRLNALINIFGKNINNICHEFSGNRSMPEIYSGDVKYHQGFKSSIQVKNNTINLLLAFNPSHLEIVNPVVMGMTKAQLDKNNTQNKNCTLSITIHGDASIIAQGVIQETLNMSRTQAHQVGGTLRIVINNQIGFTTDVQDARSTRYCTDIAKMIQAPILHVNSDNPCATIFATRLAVDFRNKFFRDVVIDLVCYRRYGHNEADEPRVTQPIMYQKIKKHPTVRTIFSNELERQQIISAEEIKNIVKNVREKIINENKTIGFQQIKNKKNICTNTINEKINKINVSFLKKLSESILNIPKEIEMESRVKKIFLQRYEMIQEKRFFDWGAAEMLCYATLICEHISIRLSGEDVVRGTFFHRHAAIYNQKNNSIYIPLHTIQNTLSKFNVWNTTLSEEASLAFEYGYSINTNKTLVIWEAQFGDFANGAQVVIDQFITSGEQKWGQKSSLVMFLPHGHEGQGPEHSSARLERYLQLCAQNNIQICIPSTPAQVYHLLRRQAQFKINCPLIIFSPKSLLRHPLATSSLKEIANYKFQEIIYDSNYEKNNHCIKRIVLCSGKIFYDLFSILKKNNIHNIAIFRIEQLYPFPDFLIKEIISKYKNVNSICWCQEEPKNQGAWNWIKSCFDSIKTHIKLTYIGRPEAASTATGYLSVYKNEQKKIIHTALDIEYLKG